MPPNARRSRASGQPRIEDVARRAGVSAQTVSRFLRNPETVSAETGARVRAAVERIGYVPNLVAGSLASNRSRVVAILVPTLATTAHAAPIQGLADVMHGAGYQTLVGTTDYDLGIEQALVEAFVGRRVDGIVLTGSALRGDAVRLLGRARVPTVQIWELPRAPIDMAVGVSNAGIGAAMARHFAASGHRRAAVIGHAAVSDTRSAAREAGFLRAARALGIAVERLTARRSARMDAAPALLDTLLESGVSAVFATGDQIALGLILACARRGVAVPGRLAITGVGDSDMAALVTPALTTVRIPRYELGAEAGRMLLARFAGGTPERPVRDLGFELVVRDSG